MGDLILLSHHRPTPADHPAPGLRRFRLLVEYDGTNYQGWQRQANGPSIQQTLEEAIQSLTGETLCVTGSSRTDSGVHALGLCAHFDSACRIPADKIAFALNTHLPADIRVRASDLAPDGFHARFSTCGKIYSYRFDNARHACAIGRQYSAHVPVRLDEALMDTEAQTLLGKHDFAAFSAKGSIVSSTVRTIYRVRVQRSGDSVTLLILGDGFLYNMVRIIAGTLSAIGTGHLKPGAFSRALQTGSRLELGMTAPAQGLTLVRVLYEGDENAALEAFEE